MKTGIVCEISHFNSLSSRNAKQLTTFDTGEAETLSPDFSTATSASSFGKETLSPVSSIDFDFDIDTETVQRICSPVSLIPREDYPSMTYLSSFRKKILLKKAEKKMSAQLSPAVDFQLEKESDSALR